MEFEFHCVKIKEPNQTFDIKYTIILITTLVYKRNKL